MTTDKNVFSSAVPTLTAADLVDSDLFVVGDNSSQSLAKMFPPALREAIGMTAAQEAKLAAIAAGATVGGGISVENSGSRLGSVGTVIELNFAARLTATRSGNKVTITGADFGPVIEIHTSQNSYDNASSTDGKVHLLAI